LRRSHDLAWRRCDCVGLAGICNTAPTLPPAADIIIDYYHGNQIGLAAVAGQWGATYVIPIIYVPALMITHIVAFYLLVRPQPKAARVVAG
jgi:hypothetical protein